MTTIVYDHKNKLIAIDSRCTAGGLIVSDSNIKHRVVDDRTYFFCGATSDQDSLIELKHDDKPEVEPDCSAFMIKDNTAYLVAFSNGFCSIGKINHNRSIGSGGDFALCALDFGKTSKEAVEYAMTKDCYSGGKVHVYDIEKGEFV